jgi:hypothetical protein
VIHLVDESKQRFVPIVERRGLDTFEDTADERFVAKQFRRDRGVGLDSKRTIVPLRGIRGDELPYAWRERRRAAKNLLGEPREMLRGLRAVGEQVPDLRILAALPLHHLNRITIRPRLGALFHIR